MSDHYLTIRTLSIGEFKDKGSKFIGYVFPIRTIEDMNNEMEKIKKEHFKARHFCYAFILGNHPSEERSNDDGEPSGTAGLPMLGQLKSNELKNVGTVVVRYFGGTKLGTSGLIQAYRGAVKEAIAMADIYEYVVSNQVSITFDYSLMGTLINLIKKQELKMIKKDFGETAKLILEMRASTTEAKLITLKSALLNISEEEYLSRKIKDIPGIKIEIQTDA